MKRLPFVVGSLAMTAALLVGTGYSQDKKDETKKDSQPLAKSQLPAGWGKLDIKGDQKKKIYAVLDSYRPKIAEFDGKIADYRAKVADLNGKISDLKGKRDKLKSDQNKAALKLLTSDQQEKLKKILADKADPGGSADAKDDKKLEPRKDESKSDKKDDTKADKKDTK